MSEDDLMEKFLMGVNMVTALSLGASYPTMASLPHVFVNCYKNVVAVALECEEYTFPQAEKIKEILAVCQGSTLLDCCKLMKSETEKVEAFVVRTRRSILNFTKFGSIFFCL